MGEHKPMNDRHRRFVDEYLIDLNAGKAAIRAGYSETSARQIACELLAREDVQDAVADAISARSERTRVTADKVIRELARIGFSDLRAFCEWGGHHVTLKSADILSDDDAACVEEVGETIGKDGSSTFKIKLHSKLRALELLGKHTRAFDLEGDGNEDKSLLIKLAYNLAEGKSD